MRKNYRTSDDGVGGFVIICIVGFVLILSMPELLILPLMFLAIWGSVFAFLVVFIGIHKLIELVVKYAKRTLLNHYKLSPTQESNFEVVFVFGIFTCALGFIFYCSSVAEKEHCEENSDDIYQIVFGYGTNSELIYVKGWCESEYVYSNLKNEGRRSQGYIILAKNRYKHMTRCMNPETCEEYMNTQVYAKHLNKIFTPIEVVRPYRNTITWVMDEYSQEALYMGAETDYPRQSAFKQLMNSPKRFE